MTARAGPCGAAAALVAQCLPVAVAVTVTVTPRAAGTKPGDVRAGSSATLGTAGQGGECGDGRGVCPALGAQDRGTGTPRQAEPPPAPRCGSVFLADDGDRDTDRGASAWREVAEGTMGLCVA